MDIDIDMYVPTHTHIQWLTWSILAAASYAAWPSAIASWYTDIDINIEIGIDI